MTIDQQTKQKELTLEDQERIYGRLIAQYACGCIEREGSRGFCPKHWEEGYLAGTREPTHERGDLPSRIEDDWVC